MVGFLQKRLPRFSLLLAVSIMGAFTFAAIEPLRAANFELENFGSNTIVSSQFYDFTQYPAEEPTLVSKAGNNQFSPLRTGIQRFSSLPGSFLPEDTLSNSLLNISIKTQYTNLKNNILLKLRI
jgi:hypothetical protein